MYRLYHTLQEVPHSGLAILSLEYMQGSLKEKNQVMFERTSNLLLITFNNPIFFEKEKMSFINIKL